MEFSPNNNVVKLCLQGMKMEDEDNSEEAAKTFLQAWSEATEDFEKFIAAYYVARHQNNTADKLKWLETVLGVSPTNKQIVADFWDLHLFNDEGLIIETWNLMDSLAIMQQLGMLKD